MSIETLEALRLSTLAQMKAIEGVGQSHSANGRQTTMASLPELTKNLVSIEAALDWKRTSANSGNKGFTSRYSSYSCE